MAEKNIKNKSTTANKKKTFKNIAEGRLYIQSTFNNTIVTVTDGKGKALAWSSAGNCGFKGARKSTPFAATTAIEKTLEEAKKHGVKKLAVYLKGPGSGRDAALRYLRTKRDFDVDMISDVTPVPHNGPRPPKQRRV
ncbi:MAG: 30S ribosomal protein S11 [Candidatus Shapirobacteria bacterium]|nr:30S ribosomal protein S11 [Candidatus Shapirobacteria bacterium]MDD4383106.1 30S ribosomal protein S11 [Candidatus Shapirobacteria bacterium]